MAVFKKILASTLALAAIAAAGTTAAATLSADNESDYCRSWSVNYTYGAPSSVSTQFVRRELSTYGKGYQTATTSFNGGGDGYVSVRVNDTQYWMITGTGRVPNNGCVIPNKESKNGKTFDFDIYAVGNYVNSSGYIHIYGYNPLNA